MMDKVMRVPSLQAENNIKRKLVRIQNFLATIILLDYANMSVEMYQIEHVQRLNKCMIFGLVFYFYQ